MKPVLSIIVPCYNQSETLPHTLDSVLKQTYQEWECIIVNDGSPDNTSEVVRKYIEMDSRFKLVEQENKGLSGARNAGVKASSGTYILPLDSDDLIMPRYAELAIKRFTENPETKLVYCEARLFGLENRYWELPKYKWDDFIFNNSIFCSCVYRRSDYDKAGGYNEKMRHGFEDWDFLLNLLDKDSVVYQIPKVLFYYRVKRNSMTIDVTHRNQSAVANQIIDNHSEMYREYVFNKMAIITPIRYNNTKELDLKIGHAVTKPIRLFRKFIHKFK